MKTLLLTSTAILAFAVQAHAQSPTTPPNKGQTLGSFFAKVGVDTHFAYTDGDGMYGDYPTITNALGYLGLTQIRDGIPAANSGTYSDYISAATMERLSVLGYRFDLVAPDYTRSISYERANIDKLFAGVGGEYNAPGMASGGLKVIEGLNEITNQNPQVSLATATMWQQSLYCLTVQANFCPAGSVDTHVANGSVAEFTSNGPIKPTTTPTQSFPAGAMNTHPYAAPSNQYLKSISYIIQNEFYNDFGVRPQPSISEAGLAVSNPLPIITESGAYQEPQSSDRTDLQYLNSYDARTMAIKDMDTLLYGFSIGAIDTYLYQLFNNYATDSDNTYGLFTYGGKNSKGDAIAVPTPAAVAIHNLTTVLKAGSVDAPTANNCLKHTFSGTQADFLSFMFQADNAGTYDIVMWRDNPNDWNKNTHSAVALAPYAVTINLVASASGSVFDPMTGTAATSSIGSTKAPVISLADDPLVIRLKTSTPSAKCN